ncbi:hypothetical protein VK792_11435 [Mesobacterium sp. TK19101]|uniref:Uncharacterized protein n=1 Tax=Mesobacterium hydrothermale TaxID=3111907 RepID=A0ABU6HIF8_9RHOB|nr:hypothetical protein [Mesobacterium sp. TK19101]MEC3861897.1 hypothetical protein [Mesobacterium sp. TK19101]
MKHGKAPPGSAGPFQFGWVWGRLQVAHLFPTFLVGKGAAMQTSHHWSNLLPDMAEQMAEPLLATLRLLARQRQAHPDDRLDHPLAHLLDEIAKLQDGPLHFAACGSQVRSFDEEWLTALVRARLRNDAESYAFLLRSRFSEHAVSRLHFALNHVHATLGLFG